MSPLVELITGAKSYGWTTSESREAFWSLATTTLTSSTAYTFSSIPQTYKHLLLIGIGLSASGASDAQLTVNGSPNYNVNTSLRFNGTSTLTQTNISGSYLAVADALMASSSPGNSSYMVLIPNYSTSVNKTIIYQSGGHQNSTTNNRSNVASGGVLTTAQTISTLTVSFAFSPLTSIPAGSIALYGIKG